MNDDWLEVAREHARDSSAREEAAAHYRRDEKALVAYQDRKAIGDEATPILNSQLHGILGRECPPDRCQSLRAVYDLTWVPDQNQGGVEGPLPAEAEQGAPPEFMHLEAQIPDSRYAIRARVLWMAGADEGWQDASFFFVVDALHGQTPWSKIDPAEVITDYLSFARSLQVPPHKIVQARHGRDQERARMARRAQAAASFAVKVTGWPDSAYGATNVVTSLSNGSQTLRKLREQDENNPMSVTENWQFIEGEAASSRDVTERDDAARLVTKIVNHAGREGLLTLTMDDGAQIVAPRSQWPLFRII